jgi:hypothetical protein
MKRFYYFSSFMYALFSSFQAILIADEYLYDLNEDFNETTNLINDSSYIPILTTLREHAWNWSSLTLNLSDTDIINKYSTWTASNGVVPWLKSDFVPHHIEQIYAYEDAPHIIFCFVDDWGYNDIGYRSTYMNFTTPNIDRLASEGIKLENYFTHETCIPSRGALLTGRYSNRLGLWKQFHNEAELPLDETTLAHEMKSAGYATYMVSEARR